MKTIKEERLQNEYELTWKEISEQKVKYFLPNKEVKVRGFLEDNGYSICVDSTDDGKKYKPRFVFHGGEVGEERKHYSDDFGLYSLKKAEEIALMQALKDFEEQLYLNRFKEVK